MKRKINLLVAFIATGLMLTSCGNSAKKQEENQKNLVEELKKEFGSRNDIIQIQFRAGDQLNAPLEEYEVVYKNDKEIVEQEYDLKTGLEEAKPPITSYPYERSKPVEFKMFPVDSIQSDYNKCLTILKTEFTGEDELDDYTFYTWEGKSNNKGTVDVEVTVNATIKAEGTHTEGRNIVTNYYEFVFKKQEDGSMKLEQ